MKKIILFIVLILLFIGSFTAYVSAITGSIGNARMILKANVGDKIEKSILIKNVNNVSIQVELSASGDLEKYINIKDEKFILNAGEQKKAYFTIKAGKSGATESKINVRFSPLNEKNGIGLSSTIIVIAKGDDSWFNNLFNNNKNNSINNSINIIPNNIKNNKMIVFSILLIITTFVFLILFILLLFLKNQKQNNINKEKIK